MSKVVANAAIEFLPGGLVAPLTHMHREPRTLGTFDGGAYASDGTPSEIGRQIKNGFRNEPAALDTSAALSIPGAHVFGGLLHDWHFGHFVAESLGRLWAIKQLGGAFESLVFFTRQPGKPIPGYARATIEALGWTKPITLVRAVTSFDMLAVPAQLAHRQWGYVYGHPAVRALFDDCRRGPHSGPRRIYVSRSKLGANDGALVLESALEANLEAEGYAIVHPQNLSVSEQMDLYAGAEQMIFSEGSAMHLANYVCRPPQRVYVVRRRASLAVFDWQAASFDAPRLEGGFHGTAQWVAEGVGDGYQKAKTILDFEALRADLAERGFISDAPWTIPDAAEFDAEAARIIEQSRFAYRLETI